MTLGEFLNLVQTVILIYTLFVVIYQSMLSRKQMQKEYEWRKHERSLSYTVYHDDKLSEVYTKITAAFGPLSQIKTPITVKAVEDKLREDKEQNPNPTSMSLQEAIFYLLSRMEDMGLAVKVGVADKDTTYELLAISICQTVGAFKDYIEVHRKETDNAALYEHAVWLALEMQAALKEKAKDPAKLNEALHNVMIPKTVTTAPLSVTATTASGSS